MQDKFGAEEINKIKIITKKSTRSETRENWVIEMGPDIFRYVIKRGYLIVDLIQVSVDEHIDVSLCPLFPLLQVGACRQILQAAACSKCAGVNEGKECDERKGLNCVNCEKAGLKERMQRAYDRKCPVYMRARETEKERTRYD